MSTALSTALSVRIWEAGCYINGLDAAQMRGTVAAMLVIEGHCATRTEALRYVRAVYS